MGMPVRGYHINLGGKIHLLMEAPFLGWDAELIKQRKPNMPAFISLC